METEGAHKISGWENKVSGCESNQRSRGRGVSALGSFLVFFFFFLDYIYLILPFLSAHFSTLTEKNLASNNF